MGEITTYSTYGLFDLFRSGSASVFLSVYFICLTREHLFMQTNKLKEILVYESVLYYWGKQTSFQTLSHCCFSELFPLVLQFPSVKAVLLSLETFPLVLRPGGSISVPGRKGRKVWIVKNGKLHHPLLYSTLWYKNTSYSEYTVTRVPSS